MSRSAGELGPARVQEAAISSPELQRTGTPEAPARILQGGLVSAAIIICALYFGREVIVPLVMAVLLAFVLAPVVSVLRRAFLPPALAIVLAVLISAAAIFGLGLVMARQAGSLASGLPVYRENLRQKLEGLHLGEWMAEAQRALENLRGMMSTGGGAARDGAVAPAAADAGATPLELLQGVAGSVLAPLATAGVVVLFAIFVLLYRADLRDRFIRLAGSSDLHRTTMAMNDAARRLSNLYLAQVGLNAALGLFMGLALWGIGLPSPALWGILAGLMRFVPFLGTFIAILPPLILAVAVEPGWSMALWVLALFLIAEPLMGQVLEPTVFGRSTGLSPVAVLVATVFWTFIWGPIGLLLATPMTVCLVVLGRHVPRFAFLDIMLGDRPSLRPEESLYQRVLENDGAGMRVQARQAVKEAPSVTAYLDGVALPALALADRDWSSEVLEAERLDEVRAQFAALLADLERDVPPLEGAAGGPVCACLPGRGRLDDLSASIAGLGLQGEGYEAAVAQQASDLAPDLAARVRLGCICLFEPSNSAASIRFEIRKWEKAFPDVPVVIGLWNASAESPLLAQIRQELGGRIIVTSIGELGALWRATSTAAAEA